MVRVETEENPAINSTTSDQKVTGLAKFFVDLRVLFIEQMLEVRTLWYWMAVFSIVMPLSMVFGFARIGSGLQDQNSLLFIITGSAIFAVATDGITTMAQRIGTMKKEGMLIYYASLPISKTAFILALLFSRLIVSLPGMLTPLLVGPFFYNVKFEFSLWVVILLPITGMAMAVIGMALGTLLNNLELVAVISNILIFLLLFAAPVFIPMEALPLPMQIFSYILPPTYAADALRHALGGTIGWTFYLDLLILIAMTAASFYALNRWLRWRLK